jgi:pyruvate dehydrogenase E2 component (dihydrolipoamide acetyltransferase)
MAVEVHMPRQGNTVESCLLVSWKKHEGDAVEAGETLCEVETDKASFEVEAPASGTLLRVLKQEGEDVPVLQLIAVIGAPGEDVHSIVEKAREGKEAAPPQSGGSVQGAPAPREWPSREGPPQGTAPISQVRASPRALRLAIDKGIDVGSVKGTGPGGRVIERDILAAIARSAQSRGPARERPSEPGPAAGARVGETGIPVRGTRKVIAERMRASLSASAQYTLDMSADATRLLAYRSLVRESRGQGGEVRITLNDMVMYAAIKTIRSFPGMNAHFLGDIIVEFERVHLGFAVDTPRGLLAPVIRNADLLGLRELAEEAGRLAEAASSGRIRPEELEGATFTVTNLGSLGVERFTPILNPPQVAILGVCAITHRAAKTEGAEGPVPHIGFSLTVDHQAVDGAPAARFLSALCRKIARFDELLAG